MRNADQVTTMERPSLEPVTNAETGKGAIKSILFHVHEDDGIDDRLQAALSLSRACSAHLQLLHVVPIHAYTAIDSYGGAFVSGEIVEALEKQAGELRARIEQHLNKEDVNWSYESVTSALVAELIRNAALSDLVVIGREPHWHEFGRTGPGLLGEIICNIRTPLCIPGDDCSAFDPFGTAVIAWNGSIEAANAVRSTIGLLKLASRVHVIRYAEGTETELDATRMLEYLSRHDVHAQMETHLAPTDISGDLLGYARRLGAEYLVLGGYSHSRAGEFLFGGVTRELLNACPISIVMAH